MSETAGPRRAPGKVRDAILAVLEEHPAGASVAQIVDGTRHIIGDVPASSVRSYLRLNTPRLFVRDVRGVYRLPGLEAEAGDANHDRKESVPVFPTVRYRNTTLVQADSIQASSHRSSCGSWSAASCPWGKALSSTRSAGPAQRWRPPRRPATRASASRTIRSTSIWLAGRSRS